MTLANARTALERDDPEHAIAPLLAAWRKVKDPRIATILDAVSARISRPPLVAPTQKQLVEEFLVLAKRGDPLDQPRLVATIGTTRSAQMVEQLEGLLEHWAPDPRFTVPLVELLKRPPFTGSSTQSAWRRLFKLLQAYGDARLVEILPALDWKALLRNYTGWGQNPDAGQVLYAATFFAERSASVVAAIAKAYAKQGVPSVGGDADLARIDELCRSATGTTLVAEVLANPAEAGARDVLADHLLEASDVRGKFMVLQRARATGAATAAQRKEERTLLAAHGVQWLGELAALVDPEHMTFEDGFLATCEIDPDRMGAVAELTGHAGWATVRRIHLAGRKWPGTFLLDPVMRSLEMVTGVYGPSVEEMLAPDRTYPWRGIGITPETTAPLGDRIARAFPRLDELHVASARGDLAWMWETFPALGTLGVVGAAPSRLATVVEAMLANTRPATVIDLTEGFHLGWQLRISAQRRELDLRCRAAWGRKRATWAELAAAALPLAGTLATIRLHDRITKAERAAVEALLAPGGTLVAV